jgi:wobble nucleotide-excising tRNase
VGQMIKNDFFKSENYKQVFVLTHSLYFFYELADKNHERRKENQKLFRMIKDVNGSQILDMKYKEIQNDYHSFWYIVKDEKQPPALIANCMRNIIEYFFSFIEKKDLNNVFQKPELQQTKYQAFRRYIDRESHSDWQNIFDFKEFNYNDFRDALGLVFKESGYMDHYQEMMK